MRFDGAKDIQSVKLAWPNYMQSLKNKFYPSVEGNNKGRKPNILIIHKNLMVTSLELLKTKYQEQNLVLLKQNNL